MKWSGSIIWIALNGWHRYHRPFDDGFRWYAGRTLRIGRGPRIRLWMSRRLSKAWSLSPLSWSATYWALRGWRSRWSPCLLSALRKVRGHSTLKRWNGRGLRSLRFKRARQWRVGIASSDPHHVRNRLFKWMATGSLMERKPMEAWALQGDGCFHKE